MRLIESAGDALLFVIVILLMIFSAMAHENDILEACAEKGHSGSAAWLGKIECRVIIDE